jgi:hypothetical protein
MARLGFSQAMLELLACLALMATVVLAGVLVFSEARVAGLLRKPRPLWIGRRSRSRAAAVASEAQSVDTAPMAEQPRLLLQILSAKLTGAGLLPPADALTVGECLRAAAGLPVEDRSRLADVASAAESVRYAAKPLSVQTLERAIFSGRELLTRLDAVIPTDARRLDHPGVP